MKRLARFPSLSETVKRRLGMSQVLDGFSCNQHRNWCKFISASFKHKISKLKSSHNGEGAVAADGVINKLGTTSF